MTAVDGGFDGVLLRFGDDCTIDTADNVLWASLATYNVQLTIRTPGRLGNRRVEAYGPSTFTGDDGTVWVRYALWDNTDECVSAIVEEVPFADVIGVMVW